MLDRLWQDVRYAVRLLLKSPTFTLIAILTLALGIGSNSAIFTVANAVLLRPLPYPDANRLVLLSTVGPKGSAAAGPFSFTRFNFMREQARSYASLAGFTPESFNLTDRGEPEELTSARVSAGFFRTLGVRPMLGRDFRPEEDTPAGKPVVIISHSLWVRRYGASNHILGQTIDLNTLPFTVIGVAPPGLHFGFLSSHVDIWAPRLFDLTMLTPQQVQAGAGFIYGVARLAPGSSIEKAQAEMDVISRRYLREHAGLADANPAFNLTVSNLRDRLVANIRSALLLLFGAVGLVLLIACANVASLVLSRALGRKKEIALRTALGATRGALVRQLLTESTILAVAGGTLGAFLGFWATRGLSALAQKNLPRVDEIHTDGLVLVFTAGISLLTAVLFGLVPSLQTSRADLNAGLRDESRGSTSGRSRNRLRAALVIAQVTLSVILLIGSGLLIRSFVQLLRVSPGIDPNNVLTMNIGLPPARYAATQQINGFFNELLRNIQTLPGVRSAAIESALPLNANRFSPALPDGQPPVPLPQRPLFEIESVSPTYFETVGAPLRAGRMFSDQDDAKAPRVVIVNETMVKRFWPNANPIGKHIYLGRMTNPVEVVGVVGDIKNISLASDPASEIYAPFPQLTMRSMNLVVRTSADPRLMVSSVRRRVEAVDKDQPITSVQTLDEVLSSSRAQPRLIMFLLGVFAATALVLAIVGIYGTLSFLVAQRTQELGIRMALGAARTDILIMVIRQGMLLTLSGVALGTLLSFVLTRLLSTLLFQVSGTDPATFIGAVVVFAAIALVASFVPARRATRVDPTLAMRAS